MLLIECEACKYMKLSISIQIQIHEALESFWHIFTIRYLHLCINLFIFILSSDSIENVNYTCSFPNQRYCVTYSSMFWPHENPKSFQKQENTEEYKII